MNRDEINYFIERHGVVEACHLVKTPDGTKVHTMSEAVVHKAMIKAHEAALEKLLLSCAEKEEWED